MTARRPYSVPERLTVFGAACACVGAAYPQIMELTRGHGIPCPMLALTGVPCPFCGLTTATVALAHGHWLRAAQVSPLTCLVAVLMAVTAPVLVARMAGAAGPPRMWSAIARRRVGWIVLAIVALNWIFELHRFGII